jgi:hypothetical protein
MKDEIAVIARLCGYASAPAFAAAFRRRHQTSPAAWRRRRGGPSRAGGPTGAFYRPAARARARRSGKGEPGAFRGQTAGEAAVWDQRIVEATERLADRRILSGEPPGRLSIEEITAEVMGPRYLRDEPEHWRRRRAEFDAWVEEHDPVSAAGGEVLSGRPVDPAAWPVLR